MCVRDLSWPEEPAIFHIFCDLLFAVYFENDIDDDGAKANDQRKCASNVHHLRLGQTSGGKSSLFLASCYCLFIPLFDLENNINRNGGEVAYLATADG